MEAKRQDIGMDIDEIKKKKRRKAPVRSARF